MEHPTLSLLYRGRKYTIRLEGKQIDLQTAIQAATEVPPDEQTLIHMGKKLVFDPDAPIAALKLSKKAMLMRKHTSSSRASTSNEPQLAELRSIDNKLTELSAQLSSADNSAERHIRGFLDRAQTAAALSRDSRCARTVEEGLMKVVERIDGLVAPSSMQDVWRAERKAIVVRAQKLLTRVDVIIDKIDDLQKDQFKVVESNRGKG